MNVKGVQTGAELVITINFDTVNQSEIFQRLFVECLQKMADEDGAIFFPIPPNRECIESVDMVLHIPIAVDYFYNYL